MIEPEYFRSLLIGTSVWKGFGWNSILYLAAITTIDPQLYEAAEIDGASRMQRVFRITLPHLVPIAVLLLTLNLGRILSEDFNQILMFMGNNAQLYEVGDVLETYVYREGLLNANYSFAAAVGLFKGFVGLGLVMTFNWVAKKLGQTALW
jgi:putative aldouronate transport system permease protein